MPARACRVTSARIPSVHQVAGDPRREHVGLDKELSQTLGGTERSQGLRIIAACCLEQPAHHVEHESTSG